MRESQNPTAEPFLSSEFYYFEGSENKHIHNWWTPRIKDLCCVWVVKMHSAHNYFIHPQSCNSHRLGQHTRVVHEPPNTSSINIYILWAKCGPTFVLFCGQIHLNVKWKGCNALCSLDWRPDQRSLLSPSQKKCIRSHLYLTCFF